MNSSSPAPTRSRSLSDDVAFLFGLLLRAYGLYALIRPMLAEGELISRYGEPKRRSVFEEMRDVLYWALVLELIKLCGDHDERSTSIYKVVKTIQDPAIAKVLEEQGSRGPQRVMLAHPSEMTMMLLEGESARATHHHAVWQRYLD